jgi:hypothetical protein
MCVCWIRLVEEKAYFSRWDDVATTQFVISKLDGRAREWYLGSEIAYKNWNELRTGQAFYFVKRHYIPPINTEPLWIISTQDSISYEN